MNPVPKVRRLRKWLLIGLSVGAVGVMCGCRTLSYYAQAVKGQYQIVAHQKPLDKWIADPETPERLKEQLELLKQLRTFAEQQLKLPVDGHYRKYVDLHRPYVVWNVQAAPRFSLEPYAWWYPFVGSLEYRGYFSETGARDYADRLLKKNYDVYVDGVEAYSTLGWFKDPALNTFIYRDEPELAEVVFHELGHQRVFAHGDTDFNEAFATTAGQEGARRWLRSRGETNRYENYLVSLRRNVEFVHLVMNTRARLEKIYGDTRDKDDKIKSAKKPPASPEDLQSAKDRAFGDLRSDYGKFKERWNGFAGYDAWFAGPLNNAQLNTVANYYDYVPGFERLLELKHGDMEKFYRAAERLAKMSKEERHQWLRELPKTNRVDLPN